MLLIGLVTLGTLLFTLLLICLILTCAKRKPHNPGITHGMSFMPQRLATNGRRGSTMDRRAMIQETSSEGSQSDSNNTLPYIAKVRVTFFCMCASRNSLIRTSYKLCVLSKWYYFYRNRTRNSWRELWRSTLCQRTSKTDFRTKRIGRFRSWYREQNTIRLHRTRVFWIRKRLRSVRPHKRAVVKPNC